MIGSTIKNNGYSEIVDKESLEEELKNEFGSEELELEPIKDGSFVLTVKDTNRKYYINSDKTVISSENILEINNIEELKTFRDDVNNGNTYEGKVVLLTTDITLDGEWIPIGKYNNTSTNPDDVINRCFKGIFDGKFHKINNLSINSTEKAKGLFALVKDGTVKNIGIESGNISGYSAVGGLVGYAYDDAKITNCYNKATIITIDRFAGGIVGYAKNNVSIENCYNTGTITTELSDIGGICGELNNSKISNCYNMGNITGKATIANFLGGVTSNIVGNCTIINSYSAATVSSINQSLSTYTGAIIGRVDDADISTIIENNYFLENTVNGGNGINVIEGTKSKSSDEMKEIYNILGNKFKEDTNIINNGYPILFWQ